jgi:hypothetical protein
MTQQDRVSIDHLASCLAENAQAEPTSDQRRQSQDTVLSKSDLAVVMRRVPEMISGLIRHCQNSTV